MQFYQSQPQTSLWLPPVVHVAGTSSVQNEPPPIFLTNCGKIGFILNCSRMATNHIQGAALAG